MADIQTFQDVSPSHAYYHWIEAIAAVKITAGTLTDPPLYSPDTNCNQGNLRVFLCRGIAYNDKSGVEKDATGAPELFVDVYKDHIYFPYVQRAAKLGIDGGPERDDQAVGALGVTATVTRAQAACLFIRALKLQPLTVAERPTPTFTDVITTHPYYGYVEHLSDLGITFGIGGGLYGPDLGLNRAAMSVFVVRAFDIPFVTIGPPDS